MRTALKAMLIPALLATAACTTASTATDASCRAFRPIAFSARGDTPETVRQVKAHNSKWVCLCEGDCPERRRG